MGCSQNPVERVASPEAEADTSTVADTGTVINVDFVESAPKDRFVITNVGTCTVENMVFELDLSQSQGGLIFDTTGAGAGVEVFQPFEVIAGDIAQISDEGVKDGDSQLALRIGNLQPGGIASFSIDVDDTLRDESALGEIRVAGSEMSGGAVQVTVGNAAPQSSAFDEVSSAVIQLPSCSVSS